MPPKISSVLIKSQLLEASLWAYSLRVVPAQNTVFEERSVPSDNRIFIILL